MKITTRIFLYFALFMAGMVCAINLSWLKYGLPACYDGSLAKIFFCVFLAIMYSYILEKHI